VIPSGRRRAFATQLKTLGYVNSNVVGFLSFLECCRHHGIETWLYLVQQFGSRGNRCLPFSGAAGRQPPKSAVCGHEQAE